MFSGCLPQWFRRCSLIIGAGLIFSGLQSQIPDSSAIVQLAFLPGNFRDFTTDALQQVYAVTPKNEVMKYSPDGQLLFQYTNNRLGELTLVDASNPFNILLYYANFQIAITLDRTLNKTGEFQLFQLGLINPAAVCVSNDNHLWVFDEVNDQLRKIGPDGQALSQSDNLSLLLGVAPHPTQLAIKGNYVFASDPALGILVFDAFGQYDRLIALKGIQTIEAIDEGFFCRLDKGYKLIAPAGQPIWPVTPPAEGKKVRLEKGRWYVLHKQGIGIFGKK